MRIRAGFPTWTCLPDPQASLGSETPRSHRAPQEEYQEDEEMCSVRLYMYRSTVAAAPFLRPGAPFLDGCANFYDPPGRAERDHRCILAEQRRSCYGVTSGQLAVYLVQSGKDSIVLRSLVLFIWAIDTLHFILVTSTVYANIVYGRSNPAILSEKTWSEIAVVIVSVVGDLGVKGIFSYRVWKLSRQWILSAIIMLFALVTLAFDLFTAIKMIISPSAPSYPPATIGSLAALAFSDIVLSVILGAVLWRRRSVFPTVNRILRTVILYGAETSVITSLGATVGIVVYVSLPNVPIFEAILWALPKFILSSLLVALNARQGLRVKSAAVTLSLNRSFDRRGSDIYAAEIEHGRA